MAPTNESGLPRTDAKTARRGDRLLLGLVLLVLALLPLWWLDIAVPRHTRFVRGTVVMFDTDADESSVRHGVTVRLDAGGIAHATNSTGAVTLVGSRVELSEVTGSLTGIRRYRLQRLLPDSPTRSRERPGGQE
jgi:hypothetical protein